MSKRDSQQGIVKPKKADKKGGATETSQGAEDEVVIVKPGSKGSLQKKKLASRRAKKR